MVVKSIKLLRLTVASLEWSLAPFSDLMSGYLLSFNLYVGWFLFVDRTENNLSSS